MTTDTPAKFIYDVTIAPGLVIPVRGPEDISEEDLIAKAWTHPKAVAWQNKNKEPKTAAAKPPAAEQSDELSLPADRTSRDLPELDTSENLIREMKAGTEATRAAAPDAIKVIQEAGSAPAARTTSMNEQIAHGNLADAWNSLNNLEKTGVGVGIPVLAYGGYKLAQKIFGGEKGEKPSAPRVEPTGAPPSTPPSTLPETPPPNNIKSRTFEAGNYGNQNIEVTAPETKMSPKEAQIAAEVKNKYGYDWGEVKMKYGLGDVPVNDMTQAEMLVNNLRNKEATAAKTPSTPASPVNPGENVLYTADELRKHYPEGQTEWNLGGKKLNAEQAAHYLNTGELPSETGATPKAAPVAETPKAPAPPPETAPKAAVAPETVESKLGKPTATTGSGMPAYQGESTANKVKHKEGNISSLAQVPKNMVFVPGGNYMDAVRNAVGQEAYTANLKSTGGFPATNEAAAAQSRQINASLNRPTREQAIAQGLPLGLNTESITQKVGGKKLVKVGGVTGALILATDLAKAAQSPDASSAGQMANTAGALGTAIFRGGVPPPALTGNLGGGGGRALRDINDFLQLKQ